MKPTQIAITTWLLLSCFSAACFGQPSAVVVGPSTTAAGELTVVSSTGSKGDNLTWIRPEGLTVMQAGCELMDSQLFFATTRPGKYEFILVVADKEARIDYARHTVTVVAAGQDPTPPTDPQPPTEPEQPAPTPGKWVPLQDLSKTNSQRINDPQTAAAIKAAIVASVQEIEGKCASGQCPGLDAAQRRVTGRIEQSLLGRQNRLSDWANGWRTPNAQLINTLGIKDVPDYIQAAKAMAAGL